MEIKYLEWNLHAMGGRGYEIPKFVVNYLKTADVFVLTEFCQTKDGKTFNMHWNPNMTYIVRLIVLKAIIKFA